MDLDLKSAALAYAAEGFHVLPLVRNGKKPASSHGFYDATVDAKQIEAWWTENPNYNIGILTGRGFIVVDLDVNHGSSTNNGLEELKKYEEAHGRFPHTVTCSTPRGGKHLYYSLDDEQPSVTGVLPGIDILGKDHYVVAPPSITENGAYTWEGPSSLKDMASAEEAVKALLCEKRETKLKTPVQPMAMSQPSASCEPRDSISAVQEGRRHQFLMHRFGIMQRQGYSDEAIRAEIASENNRLCSPPLTDDELENEIFEAFTRYEKGMIIRSEGSCLVQNATSDSVYKRLCDIDPYHQNCFCKLRDVELSQLFADIFRERIRYNITAKQWYYYDGVRWSPDTGGVGVEKLAKAFSVAFRQYVSSIDMEEDKKFIDAVNSLGYRSKRNTVIEDAKSNLAIKQSDFDSQPHLFNCRNCVLDLETGESLAHSPELFLTKVADVDYDPAAKSEDFERFMDQIMMGDRAKIAYLQTLLGYTMSGTNQREEAYILYGSTTRNGKSTLMDTIKCIFGDYGMNCQPETLAAKNKGGSNASPDVARLDGCRLLQVSEPPKRMNLDVALLKTLTGRDPITARFLYQEPFEFMPVFKLFMNTNYLPIVLDDTLFSSGRVKVITFDRHFKPWEQDMGLKDRLRTPENRSGILNWLLEGNRRSREDPKAFDLPDSVRAATEDYRVSSDKLQSFLDDCLVPADRSVLPAGEVYSLYSLWCKDNGFGIDNISNFFSELKAKGIRDCLIQIETHN